MYALTKIKKHIIKLVNEELGKKLISLPDLAYPPKNEFGDLSLPCFNLAKKLKKSPVQVAEELFKKIKSDGMISGLKASGPYLNFSLNKEFIISSIVKESNKQKKQYGFNSTGKKKRVMIEFTNANTHKEYHVGHLRNLCYGDAVTKILTANGYEAIPVSYINDFGIHTAKTVWNFNHYIEKNFSGDFQNIPEDEKGYVLGKIYVDAAKKEKEESTAKQLIRGVMKKIESRQGEEYELWQKTREWSIKHFDTIYKEMDIELEHIFYENEFVDKGRKMIKELIDRKILVKSEGAVIANLEKYNLGVLIFLRSDGTATYPVADIPLAAEKIKKYNLDKSIYVVDNRQSLYFKQLFKVLELMDFKAEMIHLDYDFVKLPSGMMSSRTGNVVTYMELIKELLKRTKHEIRNRHEDWDEEKIEKVARVLANGALKFEMIKVRAQNIITFDIDNSLSFDGYTAAYIQYVYARIQSIVRKSKIKDGKSNLESLKETKENDLVIKLAQYPEIVEIAGKNYDPSEIAKFLFELAKMFNDYYHSIPVIGAEEDIQKARIVLIQVVAQTLENGLSLLGIRMVDQM